MPTPSHTGQERRLRLQSVRPVTTRAAPSSISPMATTASIDTCRTPVAPISQATPKRTARRPTTVVASQRCRTGGSGCRVRRGPLQAGAAGRSRLQSGPGGPLRGTRRARPSGRGLPGRSTPGPSGRRGRGSPRPPAAISGRGAPTRSTPRSPRGPRPAGPAPVGPGPVVAQAAPGFVADAAQSMAHGTARRMAAPDGLVHRFAKVAAERAGQRADLLGDLAKLVIPGHVVRLRCPRRPRHPPAGGIRLDRGADLVTPKTYGRVGGCGGGAEAGVARSGGCWRRPGYL